MEDADSDTDTGQVIIDLNIMGHSHMREIHMVMSFVVFSGKKEKAKVCGYT